jgi:formate-nitrite transporter family protein
VHLTSTTPTGSVSTQSAPHGPHLEPQEEKEAEKRTTVSAAVMYEAVRRHGEFELERAPSALAWSGLAAGLSMGFSFAAEAILEAHLPDRSWRPLITKLGYPVGYLIVILGGQQLFTENTLTPVIPLLARRDRKTGMAVARLWAIVLATNLAGTIAIGTVFAHLNVFGAEVAASLTSVAEATDPRDGFAVTVLEGIFAGWLIALLAWIVGGAREPAVAVIVIFTYLVGIAGLAHVIAGSVEGWYLVASGMRSVPHYLGAFLVPTLIGNVLGGVSLVAAFNHSQVVAGSDKQG